MNKKRRNKTVVTIIMSICILLSIGFVPDRNVYAFTADKSANTYGSGNIKDAVNVILSSWGDERILSE